MIEYVYLNPLGFLCSYLSSELLVCCCLHSAWMKERSPLSRWTWSLPPTRIQTRWEFELFSFESSCQPIQATLTRFMSGTAQLNSCDHFFHIWKPSPWSSVKSCQSTNQRARFHNSSVNSQDFMFLLLFRSAARAITLLHIFLVFIAASVNNCKISFRICSTCLFR